MKINTALILCAGFGKRLNPITLKVPKPLIIIDNLELLEHNLNLIKKLRIKNIKINTFYLQDQIIQFIKNHPLKNDIEIIKDGSSILDTGGGILNLLKNSKEKDFLVFNPDTLWTIDYKETINDMIKVYFENKMENLLMVVNKVNSYDQRFKGDFELKQKVLLKDSDNNYIYTGCQIINKKLFNDIGKNKFSILEIWNSQMNKKKLYGHEYEGKFIHLTDLEIFNQLTKNQ
tara:strand:- start:331 stop:1023 length:693 start_codon:yes stop_codon:yes gene_type:complete